jgi:hypothetical protein
VSNIDDNTIIRKEHLSEEVRSLRPDLNFVTRPFGANHTVPIDILGPYGRISYGANTLEKVYTDKKETYSRVAQGTSNIQETHVDTIPIRISS